MRNDKLKINFQRIGVFLCACLFVLFGVFAFTPALAASYSYPESLQPWLNATPFYQQTTYATFGLTQTGSYILSASVPVDDGYEVVDSVYYSTLFGIPQYAFRYNGETVATQTSYPLILDVELDSTDSSLSQTVRYLYSTHYQFAAFVDQEFSAGVIYVYDSKLTIGFLTGMWNNGDFQILLASEDGEPLTVYSNGSWVEDFYRLPILVAPMTRASFTALNNSRFIPSFLDRVTSGLTAVIAWVGAVASAVISGPLSPLLGLVAVGIAVSAILLVIYLVRRFIWGA